MLTVSVAAVAGITVLGVIEQAGASAGVGATVQVRATALLNPPNAVTSTAEVDTEPGFTVGGENAAAESKKSELLIEKEHWVSKSALY